MVVAVADAQDKFDTQNIFVAV